MHEQRKIVRKLYDLSNNWIGCEVVEHISRAEAELLYPETFKRMKADPN